MTPTPSAELAATLKNLPDRPGVYLMKDARGKVIYVGKAQSLRNRVRSYWQKEVPGPEHHVIRSVVDRIAEVDYTLTDSVSEALLLENNLIKRFRRRYNVRLKDDKSLPVTSRSPSATTSRGSSGPGSCPRTAAATSGRTPRPRASTRR